MQAKGIEGSFSEYKGYPLVRKDEDIYLGQLTDKGYIHIWVMDPSDNPTQLMVELFDSETKKPVTGKQKMVKSMAEAFEFAEAWLQTYNK